MNKEILNVLSDIVNLIEFIDSVGNTHRTTTEMEIDKKICSIQSTLYELGDS